MMSFWPPNLRLKGFHVNWRRTHLLLQHALGQHMGYFIPYRYAAQSPAPAAYPGLDPLFEAATPTMKSLLGHMAGHLPTFTTWIDPVPEAPHARWQQSWYSGLDGASLYTMIAHHKPARYLEVGSGHSTRFAHQARKDQGLDMTITCIDPAPRAVLKDLPVTWHQTTLQRAPLTAIDALEAGDVLMIDSSHISMPGTDLDYVVTTVLHRLKPGVLVHFHDIFLPYGYPTTWAWRGYNEQALVASLLVSETHDLLWSSAYARRHFTAELHSAGLDRLPDDYPELNSALWLRWRSKDL